MVSDEAMWAEWSGGPPGLGVRMLPGDLPIHGTFARFRSRLYRCREHPLTASDVQQVSLLIELGDPPDGAWDRAPEYPGGPVRWTRVMSIADVEETFACRGSAQWHGVELGALDYLPEENLLGGYFSSSDDRRPQGLEHMQYLARSDRSTWHGHVPLDEVERLEISRHPWPVKPRRRGGLFARR